MESKPQGNHTLAFSDDDSDTDYISLSPSRRTGDSATAFQSVGESSTLTQRVSGSGRTEAANSANGVIDLTTGRDTRKSRKRPSPVDCGYSGKRMRADIDPVCIAIDNIELTRSLSGDGGNMAVNGSRGRKGKGKAKVGNPPGEQGMAAPPLSASGPSVEEMLAAGDISKDAVSLILFRLPDGTRLHKSFLCNHSVKVGTIFYC
jgi:hypothetical protein